MNNPLKIPEDNDGNRGTDDHSANGSNQDSERRIAILEALGGIILFSIACAFSEAGLHIYAFISYFLCVWCGLAAAFHSVNEMAKKLYWPMVAASFFLFAFLAIRTAAKERNIGDITKGEAEVPAFNNSKPKPVADERQIDSELDDPVRRTFFVMWLKQTSRFTDLPPFRAALKVSKLLPGSKTISFGFILKSLTNTPKGIIAYNTLFQLNERDVQVLEIVLPTNRFDVVSLPIPLAIQADNPFKTIRDFNGCQLYVAASENMLTNLQCIEFIANGWSVFHQDVASSFWKKDGNGASFLSQFDDGFPWQAEPFAISVHNGNFLYYANLSGPMDPLDGLHFWAPSYDHIVPRK